MKSLKKETYSSRDTPAARTFIYQDPLVRDDDEDVRNAYNHGVKVHSDVLGIEIQVNALEAILACLSQKRDADASTHASTRRLLLDD